MRSAEAEQRPDGGDTRRDDSSPETEDGATKDNARSSTNNQDSPSTPTSVDDIIFL